MNAPITRSYYWKEVELSSVCHKYATNYSFNINAMLSGKKYPSPKIHK